MAKKVERSIKRVTKYDNRPFAQEMEKLSFTHVTSNATKLDAFSLLQHQ